MVENNTGISTVDFKRKYKNTDKFRQAAIYFTEHGYYTSAPYGSSDFKKYWDEETNRCVNGYTAEDGDYISGYFYFYLNYCPIQRNVNKITTLPNGEVIVKRTQDLTFPNFYDYDAYYYSAIEEAEDLGKHLCVLKSRRKGYSYKAASMACRNFYFIPNSKTYIYASKKEYLTGDGVLTKAWDYMSFIDEHTAWGKKRSINKELHRRAGFFTKDQYGNEVEAGFKSEIIGVTLNNNPDVVRGKKAKLILFEEAGSFKELGAAWQIARPSVEDDGVAFGLMIAYGTGGDKDSNFATLKDMFYKPAAYNCLGFKNIWDDGISDKPCGFFIPQSTNMDIVDRHTGKRIYMDEDGNTFDIISRQKILEDREALISKSTSQTAVDRYIAERPLTPREAMLDLKGNIFPKKDLMEHLSNIRTNSKLQASKQVGDLVRTETGQLVWRQKKFGDILTYDIPDGEDKTGSIVIWEHPDPAAPFGLYIAGCDPYDHDVSQTGSLGSFFIYKRFNNIESYYDIIVAEYTGRPPTAEEYYENCRRLLEYYNARLLYENERKGLHVYFTQKHCEHLLVDTPDIVNDIIQDTHVNRRKGIHMTKFIKEYGLGLIKEWLNEEISPGVKRLTTILSEPLLEELIAYNDTGNFDRVIAFIMCLILREDMYNVSVKERKEEDKKEQFFGFDFFKDNTDSVVHADFIKTNF